MRQLRDEPGRLESLATGRPMGSANGLDGGHAAAAAAAAAGGKEDNKEEGEDSEPAAAAAAVDAMDADPAAAAAAATALAAALGTAPTGTPAAAPAASDEPGSPDGAAAAAAGAGATPAAKGGRGRGRARATKAAAPGGNKVAVGRGSSGYKGVCGGGPWAAQIILSSKRVSFLQAPWTGLRAACWVRSNVCIAGGLSAVHLPTAYTRIPSYLCCPGPTVELTPCLPACPFLPPNRCCRTACRAGLPLERNRLCAWAPAAPLPWVPPSPTCCCCGAPSRQERGGVKESSGVWRGAGNSAAGPCWRCLHWRGALALQKAKVLASMGGQGGHTAHSFQPMLPLSFVPHHTGGPEESVLLIFFLSLHPPCACLLPPTSSPPAVQYGDDVESVLLNFPLSLYTPLLPALDGVHLSGIQAHMNALRDGGSLQQVAEAGQQARDGEEEQEEGPQEQQEQQQAGGGAAAAAAAAAAAGAAARERSPAAANHKAAAGPPAGRASVPAPTSAERQQEQRSRSQPAAPGAAAAAAGAPPAGVAETSAAAAARAAAVAAAAPPAAPAQVLVAAEGVLQQLRNMTAAELQNGALNGGHAVRCMRFGTGFCSTLNEWFARRIAACLCSTPAAPPPLKVVA